MQYFKYDENGYWLADIWQEGGFWRDLPPLTQTVVTGKDENGEDITETVEIPQMEQYVPDGMTTTRPPDGLYLAHWDGEKWSEAGSPPPPDIGALKVAAIARTKQWVAETLDKGMIWEADGKKYTVTEQKQNRLSALIGMYLANAQFGEEMPLSWNASGEECTVWTFEALFALSNDIAAYVVPLIAKQQHAEVQINEAETAGEIEAILGDFATD